jgi:TolB-like protein
VAQPVARPSVGAADAPSSLPAKGAGGAQREVKQDWKTGAEHSSYPRDAYFTAAVTGARTQAEARSQAFTGVQQQISVEVKGQTLLEQETTTWDGRDVRATESHRRFSRLRTLGEVQGIEVALAEQAPDSSWSLLAVLGKAKFASALAQSLGELDAALATDVTTAQAALGARRQAEALLALGRAREELRTYREKRTLLSAVRPISDADRPSHDEAELGALYDRCVGALKLELVAKPVGKTIFGMLPTESVVARVLADGKPLADMPVALLRQSGTPQPLVQFTDSLGRVEWLPSEWAALSPGDHSFKVVLRLDLPGGWRRELEKRDQTFSFRVEPRNVPVRLRLDVPPGEPKAAVERKLQAMGLQSQEKAPRTLAIALQDTSYGRLQGLSSEIVRVEALVKAEVRDAQGAVLAQENLKVRGNGPTTSAALAAALGTLDWTGDAGKRLLVALDGNSGLARATLAVMPLEGISGWKQRAYAEALRSHLSEQLARRSEFRLVERDRLETLLEERTLAASGFVEESEALKMGQLSGAETMLMGTLVTVGEQVTLSLRLVGVADGTLERQATVDAPASLAPRLLAQKAVQALLEH